MVKSEIQGILVQIQRTPRGEVLGLAIWLPAEIIRTLTAGNEEEIKIKLESSNNILIIKREDG